MMASGSIRAITTAVITLTLAASPILVESCQDSSFCDTLSGYCGVPFVQGWCKATCGLCHLTTPATTTTTTAAPTTTTTTTTTTTAPTTTPTPTTPDNCVDDDSGCSGWLRYCKSSSWMRKNCKKTCSICGSNAWSQCTKTCGKGTRYKKVCDASNVCTYEFEECSTNACPSAYCQAPRESARYGMSHSCCKNDASSTEKCGKPIVNQFVFGGVDAKLKQWPWMVLIQMPASQQCAGVLINRKFVLSAAHCFTDYSDKLVDTSKYVLVAKILKLDQVSQGLKRKVLKVTVHPGYKFPENDIAIVEMNKRVKYDSRIQPVCLPGGEITPLDTTCYVTGWGMSENSGLSATNHLQEAPLQTLDRRICQTAYGRSPGNAHLMGFLNGNKGYLCAGSLTKSTDSCGGDSGGPLVCQRCSSCRWYVAGIVSFGHVRCGTAGVPAVYADVLAYEKWIAGITKIKVPVRTCPNRYGP